MVSFLLRSISVSLKVLPLPATLLLLAPVFGAAIVIAAGREKLVVEDDECISP